MIALCKSEKEMPALQPKQQIRAPEMISSDAALPWGANTYQRENRMNKAIDAWPCVQWHCLGGTAHGPDVLAVKQGKMLLNI